MLVCEVLSDTPCSILSGCVSTPIAFFFLSLQPSLLHLFFSPLSSHRFRTSWSFLNFSQGVFLFSGIKPLFCSSDFPHKRLVNRASTHYETELASSSLLVSLSSAGNSFYGKQQTQRYIFSLNVTSVSWGKKSNLQKTAFLI